MKKLILIALVVIGMFSICSKEAMATEYSATGVTILDVTAIKSSRPGATTVPFTRFHFSSVSTFGTCYSGAADIVQAPENNHLLATLMLAVAQKTPITVFVDSTITPTYTDGVCIATIILLQP